MAPRPFTETRLRRHLLEDRLSRVDEEAMVSVPEPQDRYVKIGPVRVRYWAIGDWGPLLLLIHGMVVLGTAGDNKK